MLMRNFIRTRKSVRDFKLNPLNETTLDAIGSLLTEENDLVKDHSYEYLLVADGAALAKELSGVGGYSGVMINAPAYIALNTLNESDGAYIFGAYYLEDIITKLEALNIGTCWVTLTGIDDARKKALFGYEEGNVDYILAIGYPSNEVPKGETPYTSKIALEDYVFIDSFENRSTVEELETRGLDDLFFYLRFVPSAYNRQPWRFVIKDGHVHLYIEDYKGIENLVDSGIAMYYFKALASTLGIRKDWKVESIPSEGPYKYIATIDI